MSSELSSGSNPTSPSLTGKKRGVDGPAPRAQPEDTSDVQFPEDGMPLNPGEQTVQFIPGQDPSNGDAKVEIGESGGQPKFVGLGKEELMKFANDPFWVRLRWILFILFWLIWLAMLAGAVVIILYAPKCADKLVGPTAGPYYQIDVSGFGGKLEGISEEKINYLEALGVKSVIISQVLESDDSNVKAVTNFKKVKPNYGNADAFAALVNRLKSKAIKVILQFIPNHSSIKHDWFRNETLRDSYYVTKDASVESSWASQDTPNVTGSAWEKVPDNENLTFLHQFASWEADLNYRNSDVIREINSALQHWYNLGVDGFLLSKVSFLRENLDKLDDQKATINQPSNDIVVKKILDSTGWNLTGSDGVERNPPFALVELTDIDIQRTPTFYSETTAVVSNSLADLGANFTAQDLKKAIEDTISATPRNPVHWRLGSLSSRPTQKFGRARSQALTLVAALLRGQLLLNYGDENGISAGGIYQQQGFDKPDVTFLQQALNASAAMNQTEAGGGTTEYLIPEDKPGIFVMKRSNENTYVVAANFGAEQAVAPLESFKGEATAKVIAATPNVVNASDYVGSSSEIQLPPNSAVVLEVNKA